MNTWLMPWVKLAGVWVTVVVLCLAAVLFLVWQTSGPMGRRGQVEKQVEDLSAEIQALERMVKLAAEERSVVAETGAEIDRIEGEVFGRIEDRLTAVLRDVGRIARDAGLLPEGFSYSVRREEKTNGVRFAMTFSVNGTYPQVRQLLAGLQSSSQFLIIDSISFRGEEDARSQGLSIGLQVSTYLADAEPEALRALVDLLEIEAVVLQEESAEELPSQPEMAPVDLPDEEMVVPEVEEAGTGAGEGVSETTPEERP